MSEYITFDCGCKFKLLDNGPPIRLDVSPDPNDMPKDCERTWELIGSGNTKGVFQLDKIFGQQFASKLKPNNMEHLAALSAIIRPGCVESIRDGKSVTNHFIDRKNGQEEVDYFHPDLEGMLGTTFGEMVYQEQAMQIAQHFAGFDLQQADVLRKAIGKKKADIMAKVKTEFMEGCKEQQIINEEDAEKLFGWIEKSQRYSFNKSHAVAYAYKTYSDAYLKAHFPISFFTSWLLYSKDTQDSFEEVKLLVNNAKLMGIDVMPPDFRNDFGHFHRITDLERNKFGMFEGDKIYFGFADIKGVGESAVNKIHNGVYKGETILSKHRKEWSWLEFLLFFSQEINSTSIRGMIEAGALSYMRKPRTLMVFEYNHYCELTKKEQAWLIQNAYSHIKTGKIKTLAQLLSHGISLHDNGSLKDGMCSTRKRISKINDIISFLENPPRKLIDTPDFIARVEEARMGASITARLIDGCKNLEQANCSIIEFLDHKESGTAVFIPCQIEKLKVHTRDNGDEMAFIGISDGEASMDCVAFSDIWKELKKSGTCFVENTVLVTGDRSNRGGFILKKMWQLT